MRNRALGVPTEGVWISQHHVKRDTLPDGFGTSSESILGTEMASKSRPHGPTEALPGGYYPEMEKNKVLASRLLVLSPRPRCNLTVKTHVLLKILALSCFSLLHIILSHGDCNKNLQNLSLRGPKTIPKGASTSVASWKYFRDGFGTILNSQKGSSSRALRRPRRLQKRHIFYLGLVGRLQK